MPSRVRVRVRTELRSPGRAESWLRTALLHPYRTLSSDYNLAVTAGRMSETKHAWAWFCTFTSQLSHHQQVC